MIFPVEVGDTCGSDLVTLSHLSQVSQWQVHPTILFVLFPVEMQAYVDDEKTSTAVTPVEFEKTLSSEDLVCVYVPIKRKFP